MNVGQINRGSELGELIFQTASLDRVKTIVEIGTWNGLGSTKCVMDALRMAKTIKEFWSLECSRRMYDLAVVNNGGAILTGESFTARLIHGRVVESEELTTEGLDRIQQGWLKDDLAAMRDCPNVLDTLPPRIDLLILDGGEFSTQAEFKRLRDRTRGFIFLDDTLCLKNKSVRKEILSAGEFQVIRDDQKDRNGFFVGERV